MLTPLIGYGMMNMYFNQGKRLIKTTVLIISVIVFGCSFVDSNLVVREIKSTSDNLCEYWVSGVPFAIVYDSCDCYDVGDTLKFVKKSD